MDNFTSFPSMLQQFKDEVDMTEVLSNFSSSESPEDMFSYLWNNPDAHLHLSPMVTGSQKFEEGAIKHGEIAEEKYRANDFEAVLKHYNLGLMLAPHPKVTDSQGDTCCEMHGEPILQQSDKREVSSQHFATYGSNNVFQEEKRGEEVNLTETESVTEQQSFDVRRDQSVRPKVCHRSQTSTDNQEKYGSGRGQDLHTEQIQSTDENKDVSVRPRIFVKSEFSLSQQSSETDEGEFAISNSQKQSPDQDNSGNGASALVTDPISSQGDQSSVRRISEDDGESVMIGDIGGQEYAPLISSRSGEDDDGMLENMETADSGMNDSDNREQRQERSESELSTETDSTETDSTEDVNESNESHDVTGTSESEDPQQSRDESQLSDSSGDRSLLDLIEEMKTMVTPFDISEDQQEGLEGSEAQQEGLEGADTRQEGLGEAEARQEGLGEAEARQEGLRWAEARPEGLRCAEARPEGLSGAAARQEGLRGAAARQEGLRGAEAQQEGLRGAEASQKGLRGDEASQEGLRGDEASQEGLKGDESHGSFSTESAPSAEFTNDSRGENESLGNVTRGDDVETEQNIDNEGSTQEESKATAVSNQHKLEKFKVLMSFYELRASFLYRLKVYEKSILDIDLVLKYGYPEENKIVLQSIKRNCENEIAKGAKRKSKERGLLFSFNTSEPPVLQERSPVIPALSSAVQLSYSARAGRYLVANRDIRPGEVLGVEEPFCTSINVNEHTSYCCNCLRRCVTVIPCPNCTLVMFCSEECFMKDSSHPHWPVCKVLAYVVLLRLSPSGMLAIHLLMKFKFLQMQELTERLLKEEAELPPSNRGMNEQGIYDSTDFRTVFHLQSNMNKRSPEELFDLTAEAFCITKILVQSRMYFVNEQNKPFEPDNKDVVMTGAMVFSLLMKLHSSSTSIGELKVVVDNYEKSWVENAGYGVYPAMNLLNHSCYPTASLYNHGKTLVLYSVRSISKGEPITISYGAKYRLVPKEFRLDVLKENYFFDCDCEACKEDWYPDFDDVFKLKCVRCERAIDMIRGFCSSCQIFYREGRDYGGDPPYNFFQVRDQLTQAAANCKRIKQKILKLGSTKKDRNAIISAIETMEKYVKIPCTILFDAQDALRVSFEREGSYVYVKDHTISNQHSTYYVINSAWTGRRDIAFEQSPKKSPKKRLARRQSFEPRVPDLERSYDYRLLGSDSRDRNL